MRTSGSSKTGRAGFSLLELLVVLVIMTVLVAAVTPSFVATYAESRLRSGLRQIVAVCRYARDRAVTRNEAVQVCFEVETREVYVAVGTTAEETEAPQEAADSAFLGQPRTLPDGVSFHRIEALNSEQRPRDYITFTPDGRGENVVVVLTGPQGRQAAVAVDEVTGQCRIVTLEELEGREGVR